MWLYLPTSCHSARVEVDSTSESSALFEALAQSSTWKTKSLLPQSWSRTWKRNAFLPRLFGQTYEPSTAARGVASWISSLGATRASRSATPGSASALPTPGTCGLRCGASWPKSSPSGASSRMSALICDSDSTKSPETFKAWATELRRSCLQRKKSARLMAASGSSSWPTARASYNENRTTQNAPSHGVTHGKTLAGEAAAWTTPQAHDAHGGSADRLGRYGTKAGGRNLADDVMVQRNWQTPNAAAEAPNLGSNIKNGPKSLLAQAMATTESPRATPTSRDWKDGANPSSAVGTNSLLGRQAPRMMQAGDESSPFDLISLPPSVTESPPEVGKRSDVRRRLNPRFVEWLMGWPEGWVDLTNSTSSVTALSPNRQPVLSNS